MIKMLTRHGNSLALVIDRAVLGLHHIEADTPLEIATDGQVLATTPVRDEARRAQFGQAVTMVNRCYGGALKRLAE